MNLKQNFPNTKILAHLVGWFEMDGNKDHPAGIYDSYDWRIIKSQIRLAKSVGIEGFVLDWHGPYNNVINRTAIELMGQCESEDFEFSIMLDPGIIKWLPNTANKTQSLYNAIDYAMANFSRSPKYTQLNKAPLFWEFGLGQFGIDKEALIKKYNNLNFATQNTSVLNSVTFSWVDGFPDKGIEYLRNYLASEPGTFKIPSLFYQFDDHSLVNPINSVWGGLARYISARNGDCWIDCINAIKAVSIGFPIIQVVTWNDYQEGTAIEPFVKALLSMYTKTVL